MSMLLDLKGIQISGKETLERGYAIMDKPQPLKADATNVENFFSVQDGDEDDELTIKLISIKVADNQTSHLRASLRACESESMNKVLDHEDEMQALIDAASETLFGGLVCKSHDGKHFAMQSPRMDDMTWFYLFLAHVEISKEIETSKLQLAERKLDRLCGIYLYTGSDYAPQNVISGSNGNLDFNTLDEKQRPASRTHTTARAYLTYTLLDTYATSILRKITSLTKSIERLETAIEHTTAPRLSTLSRQHTKYMQQTRRLRYERSSAFQSLATEYIISDVLSSYTPSPSTSSPPWKPQNLTNKLRTQTSEHTSLLTLTTSVRAQLSDAATRNQQHHNLSLSHLNLQIAEATRRDSRTMRAIALITMFFLPATFVTSFFGMGFFNDMDGEGGGFNGEISRWVWVYFAVAGPLTGVVLGLFWGWEVVGERGMGIGGVSGGSGSEEDVEGFEVGGVDGVGKKEV